MWLKDELVLFNKYTCKMKQAAASSRMSLIVLIYKGLCFVFVVVNIHMFMCLLVFYSHFTGMCILLFRCQVS